ncbi:cytochrome c oxidase subunit 2A [Cohnella soli]|uniref:Cytochrome c oxidase subunit 2A n=1 Tax=Cohnella soli TaxID=425005 RepID=A0ABW0I3X5_9BACL
MSVSGKPKSNDQPKPEDQPALRGTFVSVMLLGAFIAVTWVGVFILFVSRN